MKKLFLSLALLLFVTLGLVGCGSDANTITIWVGNESTEFYQAKATEFLKNSEAYSKYKVKVVGTDTGANAGEMESDNTKCADIITIAHDNIGKLAEANKLLAIADQSLIAQVEADNPDGYKSVIYSHFGGSTEQKLFAVPYIAQSLVLFYNKAKVTEEQAKTFEGLSEAAKAANAKAYTILGTDGFNFSFTILAKNASDNSTTLKLYEGGEMFNAYCQGDDEIASLRWAQRSFADANGGAWTPNSGWATEMKSGAILSVIGGAWSYNAAVSAVGENNLGVVPIPTYTLSSADVEGTNLAANTVMQGGTFADCKCFVINAASAESKYEVICQLIKYLSSKEVQNLSFKECNNMPAYLGSDAYIESIKSELTSSAYQLAVAQAKMTEYGMPQPFIDGTLNYLYYSCSAPDLYKNAIINDKDAYGTLESVRKVLYQIEFIWKTGRNLQNDSAYVYPELPHEITEQEAKDYIASQKK